MDRPRVVDGAVLATERASGEQRSWSLVDAGAWTRDAERFWKTPLFNKQTGGWNLRGTACFSGDIDGRRVRAYPVDHSIPGGHGFAVETSIGWIAYSGDIRMHGHTGDLTRQFARELQTLDLALLICEGTQAATGGAATTEEEVRLSVHQAVGAADGLVVVDWKTDTIAGDDGVDAKVARYRLQGAAYAAALEAVTGEPVARMVFVFLDRAGAIEAELPDLRAAVDEAAAAAAGLSG